MAIGAFNHVTLHQQVMAHEVRGVMLVMCDTT